VGCIAPGEKKEQEAFDSLLKKHAAVELDTRSCLVTALFFSFLSRQDFYNVIC